MIINFETFSNMELKHGMFVFTNDSCQMCKEWKEDLELLDIKNNPYFYIVECVTEKEGEDLYAITERVGYPQSVAMFENKVKWIKMGKQYGQDVIDIVNFVEEFGWKPLNKEEYDKKMDFINNPVSIKVAIAPMHYVSFVDGRDILLHANLYEEDYIYELFKQGIELIVYDYNKRSDFSDREVNIIQNYQKITKKMFINKDSNKVQIEKFSKKV